MKMKGELDQFEAKENVKENPEITTSALTNFERKVSIIRNKSANA